MTRINKDCVINYTTEPSPRVVPRRLYKAHNYIMDNSTVTKRIEEDKELLLEQLRNHGIVELACQKSEIGRSTYYRYRQQDPEFAQKADDALREGTSLMNDMAESYLLSAIRNKNMSAISLWLKAHHPAYSSKIEITGSIKHLKEELTVEQQKVVEEALRLASIITKENINQMNSDD